MVSKVELHKEYVVLRQKEKVSEARKVLKEIWDFNKGNQKVKEEPKKAETVIVPKAKDTAKKKEVSLDDLINIKGIGEETLKDIKTIFRSYSELERHVNSGKDLPFLNHIGKKIISFVKENDILYRRKE